MRRLLLLKVSLVACTSLTSFAGLTWCQDQTNASPQATANSSTDQANDQEPEDNTSIGALQKATQNPAAKLFSVPVQNNSNFGVNPGYRTQDVLDIQPAIPIGISRDWNLIARIVTPITWQPLPSSLGPPPTPEVGAYGLGDIEPTFFLSPKKHGKLIWAAGPIILLPTATSPPLGQGKLGLGPSIVVLTQPGHWSIGVLVNNVWSVAGSGSRPAVNTFLLNPFVNYNLKKGWVLSVSPMVTANWNASSGNVWTVPFGGGVGKIMKLGYQSVNISAQFYGSPVHPEGTSSWSMRLQIAFLFPTSTKQQQKK